MYNYWNIAELNVIVNELIYVYICMKVFFTASFSGKSKYQKYYDIILSSIEDHKVDLVSPEKANYKDLLSVSIINKLENTNFVHYEAIKKGVEWADAVIIEISNEDFQLGHEATLSIQDKKPVLCLSLFEDYSKKINNKYFYGAIYNEFNIDRIIKEFITKVSKELLTERFNCFLSSAQVKYIEKKAEKLGLNKSEYLRFLIEKDKGGGN
jgi:hypothetical protein